VIARAALVLAAAAAALAAVAAPPPAGAQRACGVERWRVKILSDPRANLVDFTPHGTSVAHLRELTPPEHLGARIGGVETTTYRVRATLVSMKREEDSDIHLVIADRRDPARTMIVEFPASYCTLGAAPPARAKMSSARRAIQRACGTASASEFTPLHGTATIDGVGFFDFKHGQTGIAPNAIELHPVLRFSSDSCG
jgi:hypothetical protein